MILASLKILLCDVNKNNYSLDLKMAEKLGPGHNIVTILCDSGQRYQSKIWNKSFLKSKNLPFPSWME